MEKHLKNGEAGQSGNGHSRESNNMGKREKFYFILFFFHYDMPVQGFHYCLAFSYFKVAGNGCSEDQKVATDPEVTGC